MINYSHSQNSLTCSFCIYSRSRMNLTTIILLWCNPFLIYMCMCSQTQLQEEKCLEKCRQKPDSYCVINTNNNDIVLCKRWLKEKLNTTSTPSSVGRTTTITTTTTTTTTSTTTTSSSTNTSVTISTTITTTTTTTTITATSINISNTSAANTAATTTIVGTNSNTSITMNEPTDLKEKYLDLELEIIGSREEFRSTTTTTTTTTATTTTTTNTVNISTNSTNSNNSITSISPTENQYLELEVTGSGSEEEIDIVKKLELEESTLKLDVEYSSQRTVKNINKCKVF